MTIATPKLQQKTEITNKIEMALDTIVLDMSLTTVVSRKDIKFVQIFIEKPVSMFDKFKKF